MHCISRPKANRLTLMGNFGCLNSERGGNAGFCNSNRVAPCGLWRVKKMAFWKNIESQTVFVVYCVWNVMTHAQKPDFVFRRKVVLFKSAGGRQYSRLLSAEMCASAVVMLDTPCSEVVWRVLTTGSWGVRISGSNAGYTMFRGSVKGTGYRQLRCAHQR